MSRDFSILLLAALLLYNSGCSASGPPSFLDVEFWTGAAHASWECQEIARGLDWLQNQPWGYLVDQR